MPCALQDFPGAMGTATYLSVEQIMREELHLDDDDDMSLRRSH